MITHVHSSIERASRPIARQRVALAAASLAAAAVATAATDLRAQVPPVLFEVLAGGYSPDRRVHIKAVGPNDVLQARVVLQPGGDTGWHTHPGPVVVVVTRGTLTQYEDNGCVSIYPAGSVFFESDDDLHRVVNEGSDEGEAYATFIVPHGAQPIQPAEAPRPRTCRAGGGHKH